MTELLHDFINAALPWATVATAIAVVFVCRGRAKKENKYEKQDTGTAESPKGHAAGTCRRAQRHAADYHITGKRKIQCFTYPRP